MSSHGSVRIRTWKRLLDNQIFELMDGFVYEWTGGKKFVRVLETIRTDEEWVKDFSDEKSYKLLSDITSQRKTEPRPSIAKSEYLRRMMWHEPIL